MFLKIIIEIWVSKFDEKLTHPFSLQVNNHFYLVKPKTSYIQKLHKLHRQIKSIVFIFSFLNFNNRELPEFNVQNYIIPD